MARFFFLLLTSSFLSKYNLQWTNCMQQISRPCNIINTRAGIFPSIFLLRFVQQYLPVTDYRELSKQIETILITRHDIQQPTTFKQVVVSCYFDQIVLRIIDQVLNQLTQYNLIQQVAIEQYVKIRLQHVLLGQHFLILNSQDVKELFALSKMVFNTVECSVNENLENMDIYREVLIQPSPSIDTSIRDYIIKLVNKITLQSIQFVSPEAAETSYKTNLDPQEIHIYSRNKVRYINTIGYCLSQSMNGRQQPESVGKIKILPFVVYGVYLPLYTWS